MATIILNPLHDRTHYHLVYATRSLHGLIAFRETERMATPEQREARANARQRQRLLSRSQTEMYAASVMDTAYLPALQRRYHQRARDAVLHLLREHIEVDFDVVVATALRHPLTSLVDLKGWFTAWRDERAIEYLGLTAGERVLAVRRRHRVRWRGGPLPGT